MHALLSTSRKIHIEAISLFKQQLYRRLILQVFVGRAYDFLDNCTNLAIVIYFEIIAYITKSATVY
jgi:hypothetical protein